MTDGTMIEVAYFTLLFALTSGVVLLGYLLSDGGLDALERGRKVRGISMFYGGALLACGVGFGLLYGGFWLGSEGRLLNLLGTA